MPEQDQLERAITAIRRGESAQGRQILVSLLKANPKNELAWLWLVRAMPTDDQRINALEQCLKVNPNSDTARRALEQLRSKRTVGAMPDSASRPITPEPLPGRPKSTPLPAVQNTPLSDRLAQIEKAGGEGPTSDSSSVANKSSSVEDLRPVTVRRYSYPAQPVNKPQRRISLYFVFQVFLGILLLSLIALLGWLAVKTLPVVQNDVAHKALVSTVSILETQNASLQQRIFQRQTQAVLQSTSTPAPSHTPSKTPTSSPSPTSIQDEAISRTDPENVANLAQSSVLAGSFYNSVTFSADGSLLAAASAQGITVWDARSLEQVRQIFLEQDAEVAAFAPDSTALYFSQRGDSDTSYLFGADLTNFNSLLPGIQIPGSTMALFVMPNGSAIVRVSAAASANINVVNPENGNVLYSLNHPGVPLAASLNPHSGALVTSGSAGLIQVWNLEKQQVKNVLPAHPDDVIALAFSPDGLLLASGTQDGTIQVWDTENWELLHTLIGQNQPVQALVFSPDHRLLLSADAESQITAWDTADSTSLVTFSGLPGLNDMAFSVDGAILALAGSESIEIWSQPEP